MGKPVWTKTHRPSRRDCSVWFPILCPLKVDRYGLTPASRTGSLSTHTATLVCPPSPAHQAGAVPRMSTPREYGCKQVYTLGGKLALPVSAPRARHHPPPLRGVRSECPSRPCSEVLLPTRGLRPLGPASLLTWWRVWTGDGGAARRLCSRVDADSTVAARCAAGFYRTPQRPLEP